jgi:hypothetical protein
MEEEIYLTEYRNFISSYKRGETSAEEVGEVISRMAQYFSEKNMILGCKEEILHKIAAEIIQQTDPQTLKAISAVKAEILIKATPEYANSNKIKMHLENIEQFINALKYLQKSLLQEYAQVGGM